MPYKDPKDRKRTAATKAYEQSPEVLARNRARNKARYEAMKAGKVQKGDGKDIDHITPLSKGGSTAKSNLRVLPASKNRSFKRNPDHSVKTNRK